MNPVTIAHLPLVRALLAVFPLLMAGRFAATALWSSPTGPGVLGESYVYLGLFVACGIAAVIWAVVSTTNLMLSAYIGTGLALVCAYQSVNRLALRDIYSDAIFISLVFWMSFTVAASLITMLSVQYIILHDQNARSKASQVATRTISSP